MQNNSNTISVYLVIVLFLLIPLRVYCGILENVVVKPSSQTVGVLCTYTFSFKTGTEVDSSRIPRDGRIAITFPKIYNFNLQNVAFGTCIATITGDFDSLWVEGDSTVVLRRDSTGNDIAPKTPGIVIALSEIGNPNSAVEDVRINIATYDADGRDLDDGWNKNYEFDIYDPIASFEFIDPDVQTAGEEFDLWVINAVENGGTPANGIIVVSALTGGGPAPNGSQPQFESIEIVNGFGKAPQTLYAAEAGVVIEGVADAPETHATDSTNSFTVTPGDLVKLIIGECPSPIVAGHSFNEYDPDSVTVTLYDAWKNIKTNYIDSLYFSTTDTNSTVVLPAPFKFAESDSGSKTFEGSNFVLKTAGQQTITAKAGTDSAMSNAIWVKADTIDNFLLHPDTLQQTAGLPFPLTVTDAVDAYGNAADGYVIVTLANENHNAPNGQAPVLTNITVVNGSGQAYQTLFKSEAVVFQGDAQGTSVSAQTDTITLHPGNLGSFEMLGLPSTVKPGIYFPDTVTVVVKDKYGNDKTNYNGTVKFVSTDNLANLPSPTPITGHIKQFPGSDFQLKTLGTQYITVRDQDTPSISKISAPISVVGGSISLESIEPSQNTVTQGQDSVWTVAVAVKNEADISVNINFDSAKTFIKFLAPQDVTSQYTIEHPTAFIGGGTTIAPGATREMVFTIRHVGGESGTISIFARVKTQDGDYDDSGQSGLYGSFEVQKAEVVRIVGITPSQKTVTAGDTLRHWTVRVTVGNEGGSTVNIDFDSTKLFFSRPDSFVLLKPTALNSSDSLLAGGTNDYLDFTILRTGDSLGLCNISSQVAYRVVNTGEAKTVDTLSCPEGQVTIQTPAEFAIDSVSVSRPTVTAGEPTDLEVTVHISNANGQSDLGIDLSSVDRTWVRFFKDGELQLDYQVQQPISLEASGDTVLAGGSRDSLVFRVTQVGETLGQLEAVARVSAIELNSGRVLTDSTFDSRADTLIVQSPPNISYVEGSLYPSRVDRGSTVSFRIKVENNGEATLELERENTTLQFSDGQGHSYSTYLDYPDTLLGEQDSLLVFRSKSIPSDFIEGQYQVSVTLRGEENGNDYSHSLVLQDNVTVQPRGALTIDNVSSSVPTVTAGQTKPWFINMVLSNSGATSLRLENKSIRLSTTDDVDITNQFSIIYPNLFMSSSTEYLRRGSTDTLRFKVNMVDPSTPTGWVWIGGTVTMSDSLEPDIVWHAPKERSRSVQVQDPAVLSVTDVSPSQGTVTHGQTQDWYVGVGVKNIGGSTVRIDTLKENTYLKFSRGDTNFVVIHPTSLYGQGNLLLSPGDSSGLVFTIDTTRSNVEKGLCQVDAVITAVETNTDDTFKIDTGVSEPHGWVTIQDSARVRIDSVRAMLPRHNFTNHGQSFYLQAKVSNVGNGDRADNIQIRFDSEDSLSTFPLGKTTSIDTLAAGKSRWTDSGVLVTAYSESWSEERFYAVIQAATARNTRQAAEVIPSLHPLDTVKVTIQQPAELVVDSVTTSRQSVTAGSVEDWYIYVHVGNNGEAPLRLHTPRASDIGLQGYVILPPSLHPDSLVLTGTRRRMLRYVVDQTGAESGTIRIVAKIKAIELNDAAADTLNAQGEKNIVVLSSAAVKIVRTFIDPESVLNLDKDGVGHVNKNQTFNVGVEVENRSTQLLAKVVVELGGSSDITDKKITLNNIGGQEKATAYFEVSAYGEFEYVGYDTLTANIFSAEAPDGSPVQILPPDDSTAVARIYKPAKAKVAITKNSAPSAENHVSYNQRFPITVKVANFGEESMDSVWVVLRAIPDLLVSLEEDTLLNTDPLTIAGGDTGKTVFYPYAKEVSYTVGFKAQIISARGLNSGLQSEIQPPNSDMDSTYAIIERPATLSIETVYTDKSEVNAGAKKTEDYWHITVVVTNSGDAALQIVEEKLDSIRFLVGGSEQFDYQARKPDGFNGSGTMVLNGGQTDSLIYTVEKTGTTAGWAEINIYLTVFDVNVGEQAGQWLTAIGTDSVYVRSVSEVMVKSTTVECPNNMGREAWVNKGHSFDVNVQIQTGLAIGADSVLVSLFTDGESSVSPDTFVIVEIPENDFETATFAVTAIQDLGFSDEIKENFHARILSAKAHGSEVPARIGSPRSAKDTTAVVYIQQPTVLSLNLSISPDSLLSAEQEFEVVAKVSNLGKAGIDASGRITLTPPSGYLVKVGTNYVAAPVTVAFETEQDITFTMKAANKNEEESEIVATISKIPKDINTNLEAAVYRGEDTLRVSTYKSTVIIDTVFIAEPEGATDRILSTQQIFTVQAEGTITTDLNQRRVALRLPAGCGYRFDVPSDSAKVISHGNLQFTQTWKVKAPDEPHGDPIELIVTARGVTDISEPVDARKSVTIVQTVDKALLELQEFRVASPPLVGQDVVFAVDQLATLQAWVVNRGNAGVYEDAILKLDLGQTGIRLVNPADSLKDFKVDELLEWRVQAPSSPNEVSRPIKLSLHTLPLDENTDKQCDKGGISERVLKVRTVKIGSVSVDTLYISSPQGATDDTLSTDQSFTVYAEISSQSVKDVMATIHFSSPDFTTLASGRNVATGNKVAVSWEVTAPSQESIEADKIRVIVSAYDEHYEILSLSASSDTLQVWTEQKTTFRIDAGITFPSWIDNTVSTGQRFEISAWVEHEGAPYQPSDSFTFKITKPANYFIDELREQTTADTARWTIIAPTTASSQADNFTFKLIEKPRDINSGKLGYLESAQDVFGVWTVDKAQLSLSALVTDPEPPSSTSHIWVGRQFEVTTRLDNSGVAAFIDTYKVGIDLPENFELVNSADTIRSSTESEVAWTVQAPKIITSSADTLCFRMLEYPNDQYSGQKAVVHKDSAEVIIILERGRLAVSSYTLRNRVAVARGGQAIPVLGLCLQNWRAGGAVTVQINELKFVLKDKNNDPIAPNRALARIALVNHANPSQVLAELSELPSENPILFFSEANPLTVAGNEPDSIDVVVDIRQNTNATDFCVTIDSSSAIVAYDPASDSPVGIANTDGEEVDYLGIESDYSVLISDDFAESFCNYPNPFGTPTVARTWFVYNLQEDSDIELKIFTLTGDLVWTTSYRATEDRQGQAGPHDCDIWWDGKNGKGYPVLNGVYLAYLIAKKTNETAVTKIAVVR